MKKQYIKLNENDKHLSLGNLFRVIKEISKNKTSALQTEIFCAIFEISDINETTVNNYCVGCRSIGSEYKQIYINKEKKYLTSKETFTDTIINILSIIDGKLYFIDTNKIDFINNNESANLLCKKLYNISKNDNTITKNVKEKLNKLFHENKIYETLVEILLFVILIKKQPLYEEELKRDVLDNILNDTSISSESLEEYLSLKLREGINYDHLLKKLASEGNAYANFEMGTNEYYGYFKGYPRYEEAYKYFKAAADLEHAPSNYMLGNMYIRKLIGSGSNDELEKGYKYLVKAYELGNVAACNVIGNMYYDGIYPLKKDEKEAIKYFKLASAKNYAFAFNNLAKIAEKNNDYESAFNYYKQSADLGESWACNKIGEYYRIGTIKKDMQEAFNYYNQALDSNYHTTCYYAYHNLAKYFYLNGYDDIIPTKDETKAITYFEISASNGLIDSLIELLYININKYYQTKDEKYLEKITEYKDRIEKHPNYNKEIKKTIETEIKTLKEYFNKLNFEL